MGFFRGLWIALFGKQQPKVDEFDDGPETGFADDYVLAGPYGPTPSLDATVKKHTNAYIPYRAIDDGAGSNIYDNSPASSFGSFESSPSFDAGGGSFDGGGASSDY